MNINLTIIGQIIAFFFFVLYCMKYIWPPLINIIEKRKKKIKKNILKSIKVKNNIKIFQNEIIIYFIKIKKEMIKMFNEINIIKNKIINESKKIAKKEYYNIIKLAKKEIKIKYFNMLNNLKKEIIKISLTNTKKILSGCINKLVDKKITNKIIKFF